MFGDLSGYAHAETGFGALHTYASATNLGGTLYSWASATASFDDNLTVSGGTGTGYFLADFTVDGTRDASGDAFSTSGLYWSNLPGGVPGNLQSGVHTYEGTTPIQFTYGTPFAFHAEMISNIIFAFGGFGTGLADFSNTARLSAVHVLDASGNPVTNFTLTSASGHQYLQPVPEPATLAALGLGIAAIMRRRTAP